MTAVKEMSFSKLTLLLRASAGRYNTFLTTTTDNSNYFCVWDFYIVYLYI